MKNRSILNFIFYSSALLLFSCTQKSADTNSVKPIVATNTTKDTSAQKSEITPKKDSVPPKPILNFFDFDAVDHYKIDYDGNISENKDSFNAFQKGLLKSINNDTAKFKFLNSLLNHLLNTGYPKDDKDFGYLNYLSEMGFIKTSIPKHKLNKLNQIFSEKPCPNEVNSYGCIPIFHDVYVFKRNKRVIGIAMICFSCQQFEFTGAKINTECFGYHGEYTQLKKL